MTNHSLPKHIKKAYFLGIGGIGMSALARYFQCLGVQIFGYDRSQTELTKKLVSEGMEISYHDDPETIPGDIDIIIRTPAVPESNRCYQTLSMMNVPFLKRAEVLGLLSQTKKCLAIAGTHGKTSTSTLLAHLCLEAGLDVTAFLGGISVNLNSNFHHGESEFIIVEADEYDRSFLHLKPFMAAILSTDADHLDVYGTRDSLSKSYHQFTENIEKGGGLILAETVWNQGKDWDLTGIQTIKIGQDAKLEELRATRGGSQFVLSFEGEKVPFQWNMPGAHNAANAAVALSMALRLGLPPQKLQEGMKSFLGIHRRFEKRFDNGRQVLIDDYAHHPTELKAAITAARGAYPGLKITGIFQPHLYSRTRDFADGFAESMDLLDEVILLPIYPAREKPMAGVNSEMIAARMNKKAVISSLDDVLEVLKSKERELILVLGAGDIDTIVAPIQKWMEEKYGQEKGK